MYNDLPTNLPNNNPNSRDVMFNDRTGSVACVCADTALQTYSSGVLTNGDNCCNLAVSITGWGFHGKVEWQTNSTYYVEGADPPPCPGPNNTAPWNCVLTYPSDYRFSPMWGTGWGEDGFGTISYYKDRNILNLPSILEA